MITAVCMLAVDKPVARVLGGYEPSAVWDNGIALLEWTLGLPVLRLFSSLALVVGMLVVMTVPRLRGWAPAWIVVAGTHVVCRFLTVHIKDATGRLRPAEWLAQGGEGTFFREGIAFPSGHVALFASILVPLAILAPRTRPLLLVVVFVSLARIAVNAHFVSDALGSITLAALVAWLLARAVRPFRTG
ncbi:MAG TPA: phosphatase PAP2 family protein [Kofleriaceae bacterium]|nr:phosphatase PAP2 family protein [Kofleriaceae bacterium]